MNDSWQRETDLPARSQTPRDFVRDPGKLEFLGLPGVGGVAGSGSLKSLVEQSAANGQAIALLFVPSFHGGTWTTLPTPYLCAASGQYPRSSLGVALRGASVLRDSFYSWLWDTPDFRVSKGNILLLVKNIAYQATHIMAVALTSHQSFSPVILY